MAATGYRAGDSADRYLKETGPRFISAAFSNPGGHNIIGCTDSSGYWQGDLEPSHLFTLSGSRTEVREWAAALGEEFLQDAVAIFYPDDLGSDLLAALNVGDDTAAGLLVERAGIECATVSGGYIILIGDADQVRADIKTIEERAGRGYEVTTTAGKFELVETATEFAAIVAA